MMQPSPDPPPRSASTLLPHVYDELRRIAAGQLRKEAHPETVEPSALVHEAFLKLASRPEASWKGRTHFCAVASTAIRRILVDHARRRMRLKRGGGLRRITLSEAVAPSPGLHELDLLALEEALEELARLDARAARIIELRFFGGLSEREVGEELGVARETVQKDWAHARVWLQRELGRRGTRTA